jgi:hypothetical protein
MCNEWFPVDRDDDEMIVLAEPVFKFLDEQGLSYEGPHRGRPTRDRLFEMEFSFCTKGVARKAIEGWLVEKYLFDS